jgi:hypothetical protein
MTSLSKRVCGLYKKVIRELPMMVDGKIHGIYNSKRVRITGKKNINSYEGYVLCGAASHILYECLNGPIEKYIMERGRGRNYEDHLHLRYSDILIDPTYRQMFRSNYGKGNEKYFKLLYEENPPFFVGPISDMEKLYNNLNRQHIKDFNKSLDSPMDFYEKAWKYRPKRYTISHNIEVLL